MTRLAPAIVVALLGAAPLAGQEIDTLTLRGHTYFLASDLLAGRGAGTTGERIAADYIAAQLLRMGIQPAYAGRFRQPVPLVRATVDDNATSLTLTRGAHEQPFAHGRDFLINTGGPGAFHDFSGELLLAGAPANALAAVREAGSLDGRVLVVMEPLGGAALELVPELIRRGAEGIVILIPNPAQFSLYVRSRGPDRFFVDAEVNDPVWQPELPVLLAGPALTAAILDDARIDPDAPVSKALPLGRSLRASIAVLRTTAPSANVAGIIPGSDPTLRDQYVVYTAHYDHVGVSTPVDGDSIYNGFSDNAAGVAMLLAIGEALLEEPPKRSVLLLFLGAEERGLLGASFAAARPPVPLDRIAALINLDAGAPPAPPESWRIAGGEGSPLAPIVRDVAASNQWEVELGAASPNSDYWPFLVRGVPAIFIIPGNRWEGLTDEQRDALRARWDRYHHPDDEWSAEFPFSGLKRYAEFAWQIGRTIADR